MHTTLLCTYCLGKVVCMAKFAAGRVSVQKTSVNGAALGQPLRLTQYCCHQDPASPWQLRSTWWWVVLFPEGAAGRSLPRSFGNLCQLLPLKSIKPTSSPPEVSVLAAGRTVRIMLFWDPCQLPPVESVQPTNSFKQLCILYVLDNAQLSEAQDAQSHELVGRGFMLFRVVLGKVQLAVMPHSRSFNVCLLLAGYITLSKEPVQPS